MLPKELKDIFEEYTEDDYNLYVTKVDYSGDIFLIDFALDIQAINNKGEIHQKWTIHACGHRKNRISFEFAPFIEILNDHPLLWEFTDIQCQLYFTGQCNNSEKLFYDLFATHKMLFGKYQCFDISFGEETPYFKPFQYSNGLLTQGSKKLMEKYAACLKQNGIDYNIIGEQPAEYRDGGQFIKQDSGLKVLLLGDTYIIARDFSFVRQDEDSRQH